MAARKIFNSSDENLTDFHTHPKRAPSTNLTLVQI